MNRSKTNKKTKNQIGNRRNGGGEESPHKSSKGGDDLPVVDEGRKGLRASQQRRDFSAK